VEDEILKAGNAVRHVEAERVGALRIQKCQHLTFRAFGLTFIQKLQTNTYISI
jgi:hypothetical protein